MIQIRGSSGATSYRYWRWVITSNNGGSNIKIFHIYTLTAPSGGTNLIPLQMTSNTTNTDTNPAFPDAVVSSTLSADPDDAYKAFNITAGSGEWETSTTPSVGSPAIIQIDLGPGKDAPMLYYRIKTSSENTSPNDFTLEGSHDGVEWVVQDTVENKTSWDTSTYENFTSPLP